MKTEDILSDEAQAEKELAIATAGIQGPVKQIDTGAKHPTELKCPNQAAGFREIIEGMYQTHLDKNADYSPANVLGVGEIGIIVRLWDKMIRLMNLVGFDVMVEFISYSEPKDPKNESIEDTYLDMGVCAIIGVVQRRKMGKLRRNEMNDENNWPEFSTGLPYNDPFAGMDEVADCMKCGRYAMLIESRDGDGAHACKFGCTGPTGLEKDSD